uniref:Schwann cell myelin protein-like n=1 Tax=Danio rerio TaxID=7955 RepID=F1QLD8_DANRE|nr:Schwann cell myelin protein-like [Danio rerio]|eukprot:XP_009298710.1 Schwann cell myelin protein-like [Danio rerio]
MDTTQKIIIFCFLLQGVCCRDFNISLPEKIQALSGSCVVIKCRFEINETYDKDLTERAAGVWYKDTHDKSSSPVFNSSASTQNSFIKGNITGQLNYKDCTTVFYDVTSNHSGQYFFRIEGEGGLKWTFTKSNTSVVVIESPVNPQVVLYVNEQELQDQQEVLEGRSVSLRCSADDLCSSPPATLTWSSTARIPHSESSKLQELIISDLNFTAAQRHHRVTFTCSISYQLQDNNKTAHSSITLHVQYAPQILNSSCNIGNVNVCFCEVDGNPSPVVEWHLSGRLVSNSSNMFISEERLSNTSLRSFISLDQSLTQTSTLLCVSKNTHGNESLQLLPSSTRLSFSFMLIGVAVVLLVTLISVIIYLRKERGKLQQTKQEESAKGSGQNADKENEGDSLYATVSSVEDATANPDIHRQKSIIYSSIDFKNYKAESEEVESVSCLHADYAVVQRDSGGAAEAESLVREFSRSTEAQVIERADKLTKQTPLKQSEEELFGVDSQLYEKITYHSP